MYAIVDIAGQQVKVKKGEKVYVHRLENKEGDKVSFDKVLLIDNEKDVLIGEPYLKGAAVNVKVLQHLKDDKVLVFKKKRRKGYKKLNGHRQALTQIEIESIAEKGATAAKKTTAAKQEPKKTEEVKETVAKKATATKKASTTAEKKTTSTAKKPAAKKTTATTKKATSTTAAKKPAAKKTTATKSTAAKKTTAAKKPAVKKTTAKKETKE